MNQATPFVTFAQLLQSPSRSMEIGLELELELRSFTCQLSEDASVLLRLPEIVAAHSKVLIQRVYFVYSFTEYDLIYVSAGCLLLASKIYNQRRRLLDFINVYHYLQSTSDYSPLMLFSSGYYEFKDGIEKYEYLVLKSLSFNLCYEFPHPYLYCFVKMLKLEGSMDSIVSYMNDSFHSIASVCFSPQVIATACICLVIGDKFEIWRAFEVDFEHLKHCIKFIKDMYTFDTSNRLPMFAKELKDYLLSPLKGIDS